MDCGKRKRIRCPIDPSHYIFEENLEKHCKMCPLAKKRRKQAEQPYYLENINAGGHGDLFDVESSVDDNTARFAFTENIAIDFFHGDELVAISRSIVLESCSVAHQIGSHPFRHVYSKTELSTRPRLGISAEQAIFTTAELHDSIVESIT